MRPVFALGSAFETDRLLLRSFRSDDVEDLYAIRSRPEVVRYLYGDVRTRQEVEGAVAQRMSLTRLQYDGDALALAVERRDDGRVNR
jgi:RimJ/RimL family protein N-acetyltransferase